MNNNLLFLTVLIPLLMLAPSLSYAEIVFVAPASQADCPQMKDSQMQFKSMNAAIENQTMHNGVHSPEWLKTFDVYNKHCANVTGYISP